VGCGLADEEKSNAEINDRYRFRVNTPSGAANRIPRFS
jgi:hypothetical protein